MQHTLLLVDDEPKVLSALQRLLRNEPYEILTAGNAEQAADVLADAAVDLIVCDEEMPGMPGSEFLAKVARDYPDVVRIVLTGHPTLPAALRAINEGRIYQFFTKPCNEIDLAIAIRRALEQKDLLEKSRDLLEVTKRQSMLIDEARIVRRLRGAPREERAHSAAKRDVPMERQGLLQEIDDAVQRGREFLRAVKNEKGLDSGTSAGTERRG